MLDLRPRCVGALRTVRLSVARNRDTTASHLMYAHDPPPHSGGGRREITLNLL